jgi:hypothetical protein
MLEATARLVDGTNLPYNKEHGISESVKQTQPHLHTSNRDGDPNLKLTTQGEKYQYFLRGVGWGRGVIG